MSNRQSRALGDLMELDIHQIGVTPTREYPIAGVFGFGRGIFKRRTIKSSETSYRTLNHLKTSQLVVSRLKAFEGAVAIVPKEFDGWFLSSEFPTFRCIESELDPAYMSHICRWPGFWAMLAASSKGVGARRERVHTDRLLRLRLRVHPIDEQRAIAHRLDDLLTQVHMIAHRSDMTHLVAGSIASSWLGAVVDRFDVHRKLGDIAVVARGRSPRYEPGTGLVAINQACVRWGELDLTRAREVAEDWWREVPEDSRVRPVDVLVNSTGEGTIGRVTLATESATAVPFDSHVLVVRCNAKVLLPAFLEIYLRSHNGQRQVEQAKGANTTKQTELGKAKLERFLVPVPDLNEQALLISRFRNIEGKTRQLQRVSAERSLRLSAIVPSILNEALAGLT